MQLPQREVLGKLGTSGVSFGRTVNTPIDTGARKLSSGYMTDGFCTGTVSRCTVQSDVFCGIGVLDFRRQTPVHIPRQDPVSFEHMLLFAGT